MEFLEKFIDYGTRMGYKEEKLQQYVEAQVAKMEEKEARDREREERAAARIADKEKREEDRSRQEKQAERDKEVELARIEAEQADKAREREKEREAHEIQVLQLKKDMNPPAGASDGSGTKIFSNTKIPPFDEQKDSLDQYLERFERYVEVLKYPRDKWALQLSTHLTGKALAVYIQLTPDDALNYDTLKSALLKRYQMTEDGYRLKFRTSRPEKGETPRQFQARLNSYLDKWIHMSEINKTYADVLDLLMQEQFLICCSKDLSVFLKEHKCKNIEELVKIAEYYVDAHGLSSFTFSRPALSQRGAPGSLNKITDSSKNKPESTGTTTGKGSSVFRCYICNTPGHLARDCRQRTKMHKPKTISGAVKSPSSEDITKAVAKGVEQAIQNVVKKQDGDSGTSNNPIVGLCMKKTLRKLNMACHEGEYIPVGHEGRPVCTGRLYGRKVSVLRDTGCDTAAVRTSLVKEHQFTGETVNCLLIDGTRRMFRLAKVRVDTPYLNGEITALCMKNPIYDVIIGNLPGARDPNDPDKNWIQSNDDKGMNIDSGGQMTKSASSNTGAVQTRGMKAKEAKPLKPLKVMSPISQVSANEFLKAQKEDPGIAHLWEKARGKAEGKYIFKIKGAYLVRIFKESQDGKTSMQVIIPKQYREQVMKLAHESILAGHQGTSRTYDRVSSQFFWPGMYRDIKDFCKSCDICQRTTAKGNVTKAPLGKVPLIDQPFKRVAMDIVGPIIPASEKGNRFILTVMDYATRYPEAIPLKKIDTETVAEALVDIYSRLGIPEEVLSDRGSQFTSDLMREVSRLLSVKQLVTSPYNPMCNGMIERFNGTLKTMLRRMCAEKPRDWDRYINALLFAYRETPHESLGFSPFELLYGRKVRGPMKILRELWTKEQEDSEIKTTYQYIIDLKERLQETCTMAHEMLAKSTARYKEYYDRGKKPRQLYVGDKVLVLLPTDQSKLLLQWRGPYEVMAKTGDLDYKVKIDEKVKTYHINLLKKYISRETEVQKVGAVSPLILGEPSQEPEVEVTASFGLQRDKISGQEDGGIIPLPCPRRTQTPDDVHVGKQLNSEQKKQIKMILERYKDTLTDVPKRTNVIECTIRLTTDEPVKCKPYPVPHAVRNVIQKEVQDMLDMGIIEPSDSSYAAPVTIVRKPDGNIRFCLDFRRLNRVVVFNPEPMPNPEHLFAQLSGSQYFSKIDLCKGYWQIPMSNESKSKTAFVTPDGHYQFQVMPFGLVIAGAVFTQMMRILFSNVENVVCYIDDILLHTKTWQEHINLLEKVFHILETANLSAKPSKCFVGHLNVEFLGHGIGDGKLTTNPALLKKIQDKERPKTKKEVRAFLGLTGYYRRFIPNYAEIAVPLSDLTRKGHPTKVVWEEAQERAYQTLKNSLDNPPILRLPDCEKEFILQCDASDVGIASILLQESGGTLHPVGYASRKLEPREKNYSTIERECLAIVWSIEKFDMYLFNKPFTIQTDHKPLTYLDRSKGLNRRLMRWAMFLQEYRYRVESVSGKCNYGPDYLSRVPGTE